MEKIRDSSPARDEYLDLIFQVMRENEGFLYEHSQGLYGEVAGLINDAVEHIGTAIKGGAVAQDFVRSPVLYFLNHVLVPVGGAIYVNALIGNLPACFMQLRLALESLVKCYLADLRYPDAAFFQDRLHMLEKETRQEKISISRLMKELDKNLGLKKGSVALWGKLSEDWVHARGIMDGIVGRLSEKSEVPPWGLVVPTGYEKDDLSALEELRKRLAQFRCLLQVMMQRYHQQATSSCA